MTDAASAAGDLEPFLTLAERLADTVRPIVMARFRSGIGTDTKDDASPVTEADRAAERAMRDIIEAAFPDHGIVGEEFGLTRPDAEYLWILDPIDGTKSFVVGKPTFGTLIALVHRGRPVLGVIDMPPTGDRWVGAEGRATTLNGVEISARACPDLSRAWLCATSHGMFRPGNHEKFLALEKATAQAVFGTDCLAYGLLAAGWTDIVCEDSLAPYDFAALIPVVVGAGGSVTDWTGAPLIIDPAESGKRHCVLAVGDPALLPATLSILAT